MWKRFATPTVLGIAAAVFTVLVLASSYAAAVDTADDTQGARGDNAPRSAATGEPQGGPSADFDTVWQRLKQSREQLQTGVFRAYGKESEDWGEGRIEGEVKIFCAFDAPEGRLRFDRSGPQVGGNRSAVRNPLNLSGRWFRTHDKSAWKQVGEKYVSVVAPSETPPGFISPFDVRTIGLAYWDGLHRTFDFEVVYRAYTSGPEVGPPQFQAEGNDVYLINWMIGGTSMFKSLWIDAAKGYVPFRIELRYPVRDGPPLRKQLRELKPRYQCDVSYQEVEGVWVPASLVAANQPGHQDFPTSKLELAFEWESVNQPIPDDLFTEESLGAVPGDRVTDFRVNAPVHTRRIRAPVPPPEEHGVISWRNVLIAINVVLILALAAALARRWVRRTT